MWYYPGIRLEGLRKSTKSSVSGPRFELGACRIRIRSVKHWATTFGEHVESMEKISALKVLVKTPQEKETTRKSTGEGGGRCIKSDLK
jgi:hypothetical protein